MEATGNGKSNTGIADRAMKMAIGNKTANAITTTMALRTAHCSSGGEAMAEVERALNPKKLDRCSMESCGLLSTVFPNSQLIPLLSKEIGASDPRNSLGANLPGHGIGPKKTACAVPG
jgi:hypothetical protein